MYRNLFLTNETIMYRMMNMLCLSKLTLLVFAVTYINHYAYYYQTNIAQVSVFLLLHNCIKYCIIFIIYLEKTMHVTVSSKPNQKEIITYLFDSEKIMSSINIKPHQWFNGQIKDNRIGICCFSTKHAALRSKRLIGLESG